jgi:hypothetical protein
VKHWQMCRGWQSSATGRGGLGSGGRCRPGRVQATHQRVKLAAGVDGVRQLAGRAPVHAVALHQAQQHHLKQWEGGSIELTIECANRVLEW